MKSWIEKIWKLPPPEKRKLWSLSPMGRLQVFKLERDGDYLCYVGSSVVFILGVQLLVLLTIDASLHTEILIRGDTTNANWLTLANTFSRVLGSVTLAIVAILYLRLRFTIDLRVDTIPIMITKQKLRHAGRAKAIIITLLGIAMCLIFLLADVLETIIVYFHIQSSLPLILFAQFLALFAYSMCALILLSCALILEKAIRFFPQLQAQLNQN